MFFSAALVFVTSHAVKSHIAVKSQRIKCLCMERRIIFCNLFDADTTHTAYGICKIPVDKLFLKSIASKIFAP